MALTISLYRSKIKPVVRKEPPNLNGYISVQETAEKWGVTPRQVQGLCKDNRIPGAQKFSNVWMIPENIEKPTIPIDVVDAKKKVNLSTAPWRMLEFFAGSGLVAYGMKGMFAPVWANDINERKAAVYKANFESDHFLLEDIKNVHGQDLPFAHLSWASFPCQDLSLAGNMKGIYAERSGLVWEWLRVMDEMEEMPGVLALENVSGLLSAKAGENYISLHHALVDRGYKCGAIALNSDIFVPQSRPRVFVIAVRNTVSIPDGLCGKGPNWLHNRAAEELGKQLDNWIWWQTNKPNTRTQHVSDILEPEAVFDKDDVLKLIPQRMLDELNSKEYAIATGYRRTRGGKQQLELRFDGIAGCLRTPAGGSSKQYVVIRKNGENHARLLTVREAARLMGAPDSYSLPGSYNDGYFAMGDAVVMPVINFIANRFLLPLTEALYDE